MSHTEQGGANQQRDEDSEDGVARSWNEEANRRWLAYQRGEIAAISEEDSIADLEERLRRCG